MTVPLPTTKITITRVTILATDDPTEVSGTSTVVAQHINAHLSAPSGSEQRDVGLTASQERVGYKLIADPCDLRHDDTVLDETTSVVYQVTWARERPGVDSEFDYTEAEVYIVSGQV